MTESTTTRIETPEEILKLYYSNQCLMTESTTTRIETLPHAEIRLPFLSND